MAESIYSSVHITASRTNDDSNTSQQVFDEDIGKHQYKLEQQRQSHSHEMSRKKTRRLFSLNDHSRLFALVIATCTIAHVQCSSNGSTVHEKFQRPGLESLHGIGTRIRRSLNINTQIINKLTQFGYLSESNSQAAELRDVNHMQTAIRKFQKFADLPQTGLIDAATKAQFNKPRCGIPDIPQTNNDRRKRRYAVYGRGWKSTDITWTIRRIPSIYDLTRAYHELKKALKVWSSTTLVNFHFSHSEDADIAVSFYRGEHGDISKFDGEGGTLAHAYSPGEDLGGDVHFDEDENWQVDPNKKGRYSYFSVALHEFGHSLGLLHTSRKDSLMFPWYKTISRDTKLPIDDRLGMYKLYGPNREWNTIPETTTKPNLKPHLCDVDYDAVSTIRGELLIFSGKYFWRINPSSPDEKMAIDITRFWYGLPENLEKIDAIYERPQDGKIVIFIGKYYWVFSGNEADAGYPQPITRLGFSSTVDHIGAAYVWGYSKKTYFFKNNVYWRFDEGAGKVEGNPQKIDLWDQIPEQIDSAFDYRGKTYIVRGRHYWTFGGKLMQLLDRTPSLLAAKFMGCHSEAANYEQHSLTANASNNQGKRNMASVIFWLWAVSKSIEFI